MTAITHDELGVRFDFHPASVQQAVTYATMRARAYGLAEWMISEAPQCDELKNAIDRLDEAVMWFNAGVARRTKEGAPGAHHIG